MAAVVKVTKKKMLDNLIAKITLRLGRKPTQQDVLDLCIELGVNHFEEIIDRLDPYPALTKEKITKIIQFRNEAAKHEWFDDNSAFISQDDEDIYSI
ncbi:MAG: hypothetical protein ACTSYI_02460 [Promethearchaeota archaeon]